jgi:hypothetical protein
MTRIFIWLVAVPWLAAVLLICGDAAMADINRWIDENGRVNYGDRPPASVDSEPVSIRPNVIETDRTEPEQDASRPVNDPNADVTTPADPKRPLPGWSWKFGVRQ